MDSYFEYKHAKAELAHLGEVAVLINKLTEAMASGDHPAKDHYLLNLRHLISTVGEYREALEQFIKLDSHDWDAMFGRDEPPTDELGNVTP